MSIDWLTRLWRHRSDGAAPRSSNRETVTPASGRRVRRVIHRLGHPSKDFKTTFWILTTLTLSLTFWFTLIMYWINTNG